MCKFSTRGVACALLLSLVFSMVKCNSPASPAEKIHELMLQAEAYLWHEQAADGGWHSSTHGLLRSGQALTPFVLHTLLNTQEITGLDHENKTRAATDFIRRHVSSEGVLGVKDPVLLEYPNYATAYALRVLVRQRHDEDASLIENMSAYLLNQQFDEARFIQPGHPAFGGWGFGEQRLPAGQVGYVDLSHTRRVLQALNEASTTDLEPVYKKARHFLSTLQNRSLIGTERAAYYDGGFHYSPVVFLANKGSVRQIEGKPIFSGYATATCDGLLALIATGAHRSDPALQEAIKWLDLHTELGAPEGIPVDNPAQWQRVMFYYHLSVRAESYHHVGWTDSARKKMIELLAREIRDDGSFLNEAGAPNKENDPLLATTLALSALNYLALSISE